MARSRFTRPSWWLLISLAAVLLVGLAAACGGEDPTDTPRPTATSAPPTVPPTPTEAMMEEPTDTPAAMAPIRTPTAVPTATLPPSPDEVLGVIRGGVINMQAYAPPDAGMFFEPINYNNYHVNPIVNQIIETNPETADLLDIRGDLAQEWEVSDDGTVFTFYIREGVTFHDGSPLTMDDIMMSMNGWFDPDNSGVPLVTESAGGRIQTQARQVLTYMDTWRAVDPGTLEVTLKFPSAAFFTTFSRLNFHVLRKSAYEAGDGFTFSRPETLIGTGPFVLKNYDRDISSELEANPDFFRDGRPYVDGIKNFIITDHGAVAAAFRTGQVMMPAGWNTNLSIKEAAELAKHAARAEQFNFYISPSPLYTLGVMMNVRAGAPWDNPDVRRAMNLVLHRQPAIETFSGGAALIGTPIPSGFDWSFPTEEALQMPGFREDAPGVKSADDIAEAKALMEAAGVGEGFAPNLTCRTVIEFCDVAVLVKEQLKDFLGWDVTIRQMESVAGMSAYVNGDFEFAVMANSFSYPDPDASANSYKKGSTADVARTGYYNPEAEPLWDQIATETDPDARRALVVQANDILLEDNSWPYMYFKVESMFVDKRIKGFYPPPALGHYQDWAHIWCDPSCG